MRRPRWLVLILAGAVAALGADSEEFAHNRRLLERWKADPEHYQRLRRDLLAFHALPIERQEQLRQLDRELHSGNLATQTRRWGVLDRYVTWLEKLPSEERQAIVQAEPEERLRLIREIRDRQWIEKLPARTRENLMLLSADQRAVRVARLREEDRQRRAFWEGRAGPGTQPAKLADFPKDVQDYVSELLPRLNEAEQLRLKHAEGKWPDLAKAILDLAEAHPKLPPLPRGPITCWEELPSEVEALFQQVLTRKAKNFRQTAPTGWPVFAESVTRFLRNEKLVPPPLGASRLEEMPPEVQAVVQERLWPQLGKPQRDMLARVEGQWPDYPRMLLRVARDRGVTLPGLSLPGPAELWDQARVSLPDVPDRLLMQFALHEASPEDRAKWQLNSSDPMGSREKVKREWYSKRLADQERRRKGK